MTSARAVPSFLAPPFLRRSPPTTTLFRARCRIFASVARPESSVDQIPTLVIVESPAKALTIEKILPPNYAVRSCVGHIREIPSSAKRIPAKYKSEPWARLGVDVENDFRPLYVLISGKLQIIRDLRKKLDESQQLILATDDDREGEAISWHLTEVLKPRVPVKRAVFQEITPGAILQAFSNCRQVDMNLVSAQETRRVLDRLAGYTMSPLLWKKIARGLSAGRVQSVAMSVIVKREIDRLRFRAASYCGATATFLGSSSPINATLSSIDGVRMVKGSDFADETGELTQTARDKALPPFHHDRMQTLCDSLDRQNARVKSVVNRNTLRHPPLPLITSTLQQECGNQFGFGAGRTMRVAQKLYENGLITYMRTDNPKLSDSAVESCREAVERLHGKDMLRDQDTKTRRAKTKAAQAAHEAIRPAGTKFKEPHELTELDKDEHAVYSLIFRRTLASQMCSAKLHKTTIKIDVPILGDEAHSMVEFRASGTTVIHPGFLKAYESNDAEEDSSFLPQVEEGMTLDVQEIEVLDHATKPPARYNDASLVKVLEELGVGRPSTYAGIIEKLITRGYVYRGSSLREEKKIPQRALVPGLTAFAVEKLLGQHFPSFIDAEFTADMETALDQIAAGNAERTQFLKDYYCGENGLASSVERSENDIHASVFRRILLPNMPTEMLEAAEEGAGIRGAQRASSTTGTVASASENGTASREHDSAVSNDDDWAHTKVLVSSYGPYVERGGKVVASLPKTTLADDLSADRLRKILRIAEDPVIGTDPKTGMSMLLKTSRYGPYLQLGGEDDYSDGEKPKRSGLLPGMDVEDINVEVASKLLSLPRLLGTHPETGREIQAAIGPYGPYVVHGDTFVSLRNSDLGVLDVEFPEALELVNASEHRKRLRSEKQAQKLKDSDATDNKKSGSKSPSKKPASPKSRKNPKIRAAVAKRKT
ncbi:DNA topoisomerase I Mitochondrial [Gracilaria domingensis]|nr:DNA topoisomerase I Mitochondrial [Gracilaria domingensis]